MAVSVKISEIIDAIEFNNDFRESYINKKTGKVYNIGEEYFRWAEDEEMSEGLADWEKDEIAISKEILYSDDYITLPDKFEFNEYRLMEKFCLSLSDENLKDLAVNWCKENGFTILDE